MSNVKPGPGRPWVAAAFQTSLRVGATTALLCALAACGSDAPEDAAATADPAAADIAEQVPPAEAVSAEVAAMDADALREAASAALREQRLYAPAGNNAMEYYLALRDKQPNDPSVASALTDLMPYTLIATEQSIGREDFEEAQRLLALMEKTNPNAPALPRLRQTIDDSQQQVASRAEAEARQEQEAERRQQLEAERAAEQQRAQQEAARQLAAQQAAARAAEEQREREAAAAAQPAQPAPAQPAPVQQPATPARTANTELIPVSTPAPQFPPDAYRSRQSGEVQVEFVVGTDGSVTSARVVRSNPRRVFDRAALEAVNRWRFQPVAAPVTSRRTIGFDPEA